MWGEGWNPRADRHHTHAERQARHHTHTRKPADKWRRPFLHTLRMKLGPAVLERRRDPPRYHEELRRSDGEEWCKTVWSSCWGGSWSCFSLSTNASTETQHAEYTRILLSTVPLSPFCLFLSLFDICLFVWQVVVVVVVTCIYLFAGLFISLSFCVCVFCLFVCFVLF